MCKDIWQFGFCNICRSSLVQSNMLDGPWCLVWEYGLEGQSTRCWDFVTWLDRRRNEQNPEKLTIYSGDLWRNFKNFSDRSYGQFVLFLLKATYRFELVCGRSNIRHQSWRSTCGWVSPAVQTLTGELSEETNVLVWCVKGQEILQIKT